MRKEEMSLEDAVKIVFDPDNKKAKMKYDEPYQLAIERINKAIRENPEYAALYKNKPIPPKSVCLSMVEAAKSGLDQNAQLKADRLVRRKIIAKRLKHIRQEHNLTQEEISRAINWNVLTYRGYENCKSDVPIVILIRLADFYQVSLDYLTGRTNNKVQNNPDLEERISKLEEALRKLTDNG
ncbi:MAG TPA: helix-turn-helix transcriptional regulator [Clostridiales bacterium]|nr:helix-turn-helix transcriptional regulator [Clostridiales bacterium]